MWQNLSRISYAEILIFCRRHRAGIVAARCRMSSTRYNSCTVVWNACWVPSVVLDSTILTIIAALPMLLEQRRGRFL